MEFRVDCLGEQLLLTLVYFQTMARFSRRMSSALRPVHRIKHVVDTAATVAAAAVFEQDLIATVDAPILSSTNQVETGSKVNGIYLKVVVASNEANVAGAIPNVYLIVFKNPGDNINTPNPNNVGPNNNKRFVIHQEMTMIINQVSSNPSILFNGVIKIPRGYIRNGPNDKLILAVLSPSIDISVCIQCHYKEFR